MMVQVPRAGGLYSSPAAYVRGSVASAIRRRGATSGRAKAGFGAIGAIGVSMAQSSPAEMRITGAASEGTEASSIARASPR